MRTVLSVLLLAGFVAAPSWAGLKFVATPNLASYEGPAAGSMALSVDLDGMTTGSIQFVTGPALSASPISLSFVAQAGAMGAVPTITSTSTDAAGGWNPVIAPTPTTFTAFNFSAQPLSAASPSEIVGQVDFSVATGSMGMFDLMASAFALDGVDMPAQVIGTINVALPCEAVVFANTTLDVTKTVQACGTLTVGPNVTVMAPGDARFYAGGGVTFVGTVAAQPNTLVTAGTCGQSLCSALGVPLEASCMPCVADICAVDPFCCNTFWDGKCIDEVNSICNLSCP